MQLASLKSEEGIRKKTCSQTSCEKSIAKGKVKRITGSRKYPLYIKAFVLKIHYHKI